MPPVTPLLLTAMSVVFAYAIYIASMTARRTVRAADYLDGGGAMHPWSLIFASLGIVVGSMGLYDHYLLLALFGLPYNHVTIGIVLVALCAALVQKRLWLAARITGKRSLGELLGAYYDSNGLRTLVFLLLVLFAVPFCAQSLARIGLVIETASGGLIAGPAAIWPVAFFLFLVGAIGGWRAVIYSIAMQSLLIVVLAVLNSTVAAFGFDWLAAVVRNTPDDGMIADRIPGVIRYSAGVGRDAAPGGIWTTAAILSASISLIGIVLSPAFVHLSVNVRARTAFAFGQVWMIAALGCGLMLILSPIMAAGLKATAGSAVGSYAGLFDALGSLDPLFAVCVALILVSALQIAVSFFAQAGATLFVNDLLKPHVLPRLSPQGEVLGARIALSAIFFAAASLASFAPWLAEVLGTTTLSLSAQLFPAILGLCWVRWIGRGAVITGLIFGIIAVLFTEALGPLVFDSLFVPLPWGRWPLTIHSAAWGLFFNIAACLLVSIFTPGGSEREQRDRLHNVFPRDHRPDLGGRAARNAKWSLILVWTFFAVGPGAIMGNWFFSRPIFTQTDLALGLPSLAVWQILFWSLGVLLVWWIAYQAQMSVIEADVETRISLEAERDSFASPGPLWIKMFLERFAGR